ncbi:MAG: hypothetical protein AAGJ28_06270 [Pseudomonadota bacterium]
MIGLIFGFLLVGGCWWYLQRRLNAQRELVRLNRPAYAERAYTLKSAAISQDMVPIFNQLRLRGARIDIVGADGRYFLSEMCDFFSEALTGWAKDVQRINYYLVRPCPDALAVMRKLEVSLGGKLRVFAVDSTVEDVRIREIAGKLETLHPTLVTMPNDGGSERAMWVEYYHGLRTRHAYSVKYVSPIAIKDPEETKEFEVYEGLVEELRVYFSDQDPVTPNNFAKAA